MKKHKIKISKTSSMHFAKLAVRSLFFIAALLLYIFARIKGANGIFAGYERKPKLLAIIWIAYAIEMAVRFFPSHIESPGCQKQFAKNFMPTQCKTPELLPHKKTFAVAISWILLNAAIGALYFAKLIDAGILVLISLAYGVCDMICILFFCPFQTWFMKNRCCGDCRIYNWDFAMMFTPFVFIPHWYTYSLLFLSLALLIRWELTLHRHPERFSASTNDFISCKNCGEKLCKHKKQLQKLLKNRHIFK